MNHARKVVWAVLIKSSKRKSEVDASFVGNEMRGGQKMIFGGGRIADDEQPAEIEMRDFLIAIQCQRTFEQSSGLSGMRWITSQLERLKIEFGRRIGAAKCRGDCQTEEADASDDA